MAERRIGAMNKLLPGARSPILSESLSRFIPIPIPRSPATFPLLFLFPGYPAARTRPTLEHTLHYRLSRASKGRDSC
jgi:hypothetical protein